MSEVELKPCPFCGGEAKYSSEDGISVSCTKFECIIGDLMTLGFDSKEEAAERWNIRHCGICPYVEGLKSRNFELEARNIELARQIVEYNQKYQDDHATVPYLKYEIDTLKAKISTLETKNSDLETENHGLDENIYHYKNLLEDYEDRIAHFEQLLGRYYERDVARDKGRLQRAREYFEEALYKHEGGA